MSDAAMGFLLSVFVAGLITLTWAKVTDRARMRRTQAAHDAAMQGG